MSENLARQFLIREDVVFLNHGSFGACPRPVFEAYQNWQLELERQPVAFLGRDLTEHMRVPRVAHRRNRSRTTSASTRAIGSGNAASEAIFRS